MSKLLNFTLTGYITFVMLSEALMPPLNIISLDNILFPFAFLAITYHYLKNKIFWINALLISLIIGFSLLSNCLNEGLTINETIWSLRWLKLFTVGWSAFFVFTNNRKMFESIILFVFIGMIIINALQLLGVEGIIKLYEPSSQQSNLVTYSLTNGRLSGTFINPNNNGLIMALFGIYFLFSEFRSKYIFVTMSGAIILMTQSRTVFLAYLAFIVLFSLYILFKQHGRKFIYLLSGFVVFIFVVAQMRLRNISSIFDGSAFQSNSVNIRYIVIQKTLDVNKSDKWFGHGKIEDIPKYLGYSIDNEYAYIYLEYGVIGLLLFLLLVTFLCVLTFSQKKFHAGIGLILVMLICGLTNLSFTNMEVGPTFALLFAATYGTTMFDKSKIIE